MLSTYLFYNLINILKSIQNPTILSKIVEDCSFQKKRVCAYNSIKFPCQIEKNYFFLQISGDNSDYLFVLVNNLRIYKEKLVAGVGFEPTTFRL